MDALLESFNESLILGCLNQSEIDNYLDLPAERKHEALKWPEEGTGLNSSLPKRAKFLNLLGWEDDAIEADLSSYYCDTMGRSSSDVTRAMETAERWLLEDQTGIKPAGSPIRKTSANWDQLSKMPRLTKEEIAANSPMPAENVTRAGFIRSLWRDDEWVYLAQDFKDAHSKPYTPAHAADMVGKPELQDHFFFIVPSSMVGDEQTKTQAGSLGYRNLNNVSHRKYMVLECDGIAGQGDRTEEVIERFSGFCAYMAEHAPLVAIIDSGNKSLHHWFDVQDLTEDEFNAAASLAITYGADKSIGNKSALVRFLNDNASDTTRSPQRLIYWNDPTKAEMRAWAVEDLRGAIQRPYKQTLVASDSDKFYDWSDTFSAWQVYSRISMTVNLKTMGLSAKVDKSATSSEVDDILGHASKERRVSAAYNTLAGYSAGVYTSSDDQRFLVQKNANLVMPEANEAGFPQTLKFLSDLFIDEDGGDVQLQTMLSWLSHALKALYKKRGGKSDMFKFSQMLTICGDPGSGKSYLRKHVLAPLFGGRSVNAASYFDSKSTSSFNAELFTAELLVLDDVDTLLPTAAARKEQASRIRALVASQDNQSLNAKYQTPVMVQPFWRVVRLMNNSAADLATLPEITSSGISDKITLLRARKFSGDFSRDMDKAFASERPAFLHYLLSEHKIPTDLASARYGVREYHNPELLEDHREVNHDMELEDVLDKFASMLRQDSHTLPDGTPCLFFRQRQLAVRLNELATTEPGFAKMIESATKNFSGKCRRLAEESARVVSSSTLPPELAELPQYKDLHDGTKSTNPYYILLPQGYKLQTICIADQFDTLELEDDLI